MTLRALLITPFVHPLGDALLKLFVRVALAAPFYLSGRTKVDEGSLFSISDTTHTLFENDYAAVPLPAHFAALAATVAEHLLPVLLVIGLGTRVAALGLFVMTMVIQLFVYPGAWWGVHMQWVALALVVILHGPGRLSLDELLLRNRRP